jgi:hypothetical protein
VRVLANGDVRIENNGNWYSPSTPVSPRRVDRAQTAAHIDLRLPQLAYTLSIKAERQRLHIAVDLAEPLPENLQGRAALFFEFSPPDLLGKSFHLGTTHATFPHQANGPVLTAVNGQLPVAALAEGDCLTIAPEDPLRWMSLARSDGGSLALFDERNTYHHYWFVLRAMLLPGRTRAADVTLWANSIADWRRAPVLLHSQVGYHPAQQKRAWIECDARDNLPDYADLRRIEPESGPQNVLRAALQPWGRYLRYQYAAFDFSAVTETGLYQISCAGQVSEPFRIAADVYQKDVWQPTLDTFFPVQMCHMAVRDRFRVWHGVCHLDDAVQAPLEHIHFDAYRQGPTTDTDFAPHSHIPGLDRGGWHDAGDFDLAAGSQAATTYTLALCREAFGVDYDQTSVDWQRRQVEIHRPDGVPDLLQQIRHGVENLVGGYRAAGHSFCGIIEGDLLQYAHQGDPGVQTDNCLYDPALALDERQGNRSGKPDDRWAFTSRATALEYRLAATLAIAGQALAGYADDLAQECRQTAQEIWTYEQSHDPVIFHAEYVPRDWAVEAICAAVELLLATGEDTYRQYLLAHLEIIAAHPAELGGLVSRALPQIAAPTFAEGLRRAMQTYRQTLGEETAGNPFGLPMHFGHGGIAWSLLSLGVQCYYLAQAYPDLFEKEWLYRVVHYVLGVHPGSTIALVSGVGARSLTTAFGFNRSDFSYIPGGVVLGTNLIQPDFPELKEGHSFIWQQTEYVIHGAATYLFCVLAAERCLVSEE